MAPNFGVCEGPPLDQGLKENLPILLAAIEENAAHALISTTTDGIITSFNKAAENMLGYKASELVGLKTPGTFHDLEQVVQRSEEYTTTLGRHIEPGFETFVCHTDAGLKNQYEWTYVHKNGTKFPVLLSITALYDHKGKKLGYLGVAQDISEIRKKEAQLAKSNLELKKANKELADFAYMASHDLKGPLIKIKTLSSIIKEDLENGMISESTNNIERITRIANSLKKLIDDIFDLVSIGGIVDYQVGVKKPILEKAEPINVEEFFQETCHIHSGKYNTSPVEFIFDSDGEKPLLPPGRFKQILSNLISNAVKYKDSDKNRPFVSVRSFRANDNYVLEVEDNGLGIPEQHQPQMFVKFKRFHTDQADGSGLGMIIVKKNVEALKGSIRFTSTETKGTNFRICIPKVFKEKK